MRTKECLKPVALSGLLALLISPAVLAQYVPPTPFSVKEDAVALLGSVLPTGHKETNQRMVQAIQKLEASLHPNLWIDNERLVRETGIKVFKAEMKAIERLEAVLDDFGAPIGTKNHIEDVLFELMIADRLLTDVARDDAIATRASADCAGVGNGNGNNPSDCNCAASSLEIEEAEGQFALAWTAIGASNFAQAADIYEQIWRNSQQSQLAVEQCPVLPLSCPCDGASKFLRFTDGTADVTLCRYEVDMNEAVAESVIYTGDGAEAVVAFGDEAECSYRTVWPSFSNRITIDEAEALHCIDLLVATAADCLAGQ